MPALLPAAKPEGNPQTPRSFRGGCLSCSAAFKNICGDGLGLGHHTAGDDSIKTLADRDRSKNKINIIHV
jgi:hypothetical protein